MNISGTSFAAIDILKLTGNQLNEKNFSIFNPVTSEMGYFNISIQDAKSRDKRYCVALVQFVEDAFTEEAVPTYHIEVIDVSPNASPDGIVYSTALDDDSIQITLKRNLQNENGCLIRQIGSQDWNRDFCTTKYFDNSYTSCQCLRLGFIRLGKVLIPTTTTSSPAPTLNGIIVSPTSAMVGSSTNQKQTTKVTTEKPKTPKVSTKVQSDTVNVSEASTASAWYYVIPVLFVAFVIGIIVFLVYNERRRANEKRLKALSMILVGFFFIFLLYFFVFETFSGSTKERCSTRNKIFQVS